MSLTGDVKLPIDIDEFNSIMEITKSLQKRIGTNALPEDGSKPPFRPVTTTVMKMSFSCMLEKIRRIKDEFLEADTEDASIKLKTACDIIRSMGSALYNFVNMSRWILHFISMPELEKPANALTCKFLDAFISFAFFLVATPDRAKSRQSLDKMWNYIEELNSLPWYTSLKQHIILILAENQAMESFAATLQTEFQHPAIIYEDEMQYKNDNVRQIEENRCIIPSCILIVRTVERFYNYLVALLKKIEENKMLKESELKLQQIDRLVLELREQTHKSIDSKHQKIDVIVTCHQQIMNLMDKVISVLEEVPDLKDKREYINMLQVTTRRLYETAQERLNSKQVEYKLKPTVTLYEKNF
ncbi:uncharacterized protein LOC126318290 [Schistocerca gregaria]|uniref:uncharacterized protein LOC126318290 n=1 Tax=Schistocerca gregaria TaxID=7010 RepID=UPI00211F14FC|nr:uncharacterized protein LOC126318290 [Schistocerca gregaria]